MSGKELQKQLTWEFPHIGKEKPQQIEEAAAFCEGYKTFLNRGKTERECVKTAEELLKAAGYQVYDETKTYQPGDTAPSAGVRTYGFGNFRMLMGSFSNDAYGNYTRYTYASCKDSVVLSVHGETIVLNGPDTASTQALCEELTAQLAAR